MGCSEDILDCVKSVRIRSFSDSYFPAFGLNTDWIHCQCGNIRTRNTPNTDTFYAVLAIFSTSYVRSIYILYPESNLWESYWITDQNNLLNFVDILQFNQKMLKNLPLNWERNDLLCKSPYSLQIRENADQKKLHILDTFQAVRGFREVLIDTYFKGNMRL